MTAYRIPFNKPFIAGKELYHVAQAVLGGHSSGDGPYGKRCEAFIKDFLDTKHALMTTSSSAAIDMAALVCGIGEGDEVILPSFTAAGTANAFLHRGAKLVFCDIDPTTLTLDPCAVAEALTERTRAIVPRHYAGVSPDMTELLSMARAKDIWIIEDAAEAFNARYRDRSLGTIGHLGAFSFHETKDFSCGEGGALVTSDNELFEKAEILREKGTNRSQFFRGQVDKYTWVAIGSSYIPSDILSAYLYGQFENLSAVHKKREQLYARYLENLNPVASEETFELPTVPQHAGSNFHRFHVLLRRPETRPELVESLRQHSILAVPHFFPLHISSMGKKYGFGPGALPRTEQAASRILRLPFFYGLGLHEVDEVCDHIRDFFLGARRWGAQGRQNG